MVARRCWVVDLGHGKYLGSRKQRGGVHSYPRVDFEQARIFVRFGDAKCHAGLSGGTVRDMNLQPGDACGIR